MAVIIPALYTILSLLCWAFACRFGGKTAWWAFGFFLLATGATTASGLASMTWGRVNYYLWATDIAYFIALFLLAHRSPNYWPQWQAGFQLLAAMSHIGPLVDHGSDPHIYRALETVWMIPMLGTMVIGVNRDRRIGRRRALRNERATTPDIAR
jgi:hypothetical protein